LKNTYFLLLLFLIGCSTPQKEEPESQEQLPEEIVAKVPKPVITVDIPNYQFSFANLKLNQTLGETDLRVFKHYGEFFTEDFNIYRLDRIDYLAESYFIDDINLYFIDDLLVKIQAYLKEDKTNEFMNRYGKARIVINDYHNKKLLETESILTKANGKYRINEKIDYYKLRWMTEEADIEYMVNKKIDTTKIIQADDIRHFDDKRHRYKITFTAKDFDDQMAWVRWESYKQSRGLVAEPATED